MFVPRPKVESALVEIVRHEPPLDDPTTMFTLVRTAFGQRRKMLRRSLAELVTPEQFAAAGVAPTAPPEELAVEEWCRLARSLELTAPAKLTWTLRVIGVRADGYHLLDAEMVTLDLADELTIGERDDGRSSLTVDGPFADGVPTDDSNLVHQALRAAGRGADVHLDKRIPNGGGLGGGSADAAAVLRWAGIDDPLAAVAVGADVPFCVVGGRARVSGIGEVVEPLEPVERDGHAGGPAAARQHAGRLPRLGRARRPDGRGCATTSSRRRSWWRRSWRVARPHRRAEWRDAGAGRSGATWFVEGDSSTRCRRCERPGRPSSTPDPVTHVLDIENHSDQIADRDAERRCYLRRWWRVRRSIFLCFFLRMRLRRFLISEPIGPCTLPARWRLRRRPRRYREWRPSGVVQ